ncbi:tape measure protein [Rubrivivax sp. JA1026]|uniref:tape measure protein n=1 Tax=Rubrivivax sp. JA1026 TaxID=2710888 RepID=UPI0013E991C4|nr:tape measure protein [Rubrivivax sp. JA1026]
MTDPRIRYDILANAEGEQDVLGLAAALEKVDDSLDPTVAARAQKLATELRELGQQKAAVDTFVTLKRETEGAKRALDQAQAAAQQLGRELAATEAPTRAQTGQMAKLRDAVQSAKEKLQQKTQQLDVSRAALTQMGLSTEQVAAKERELRDALQSARTEVANFAKAAQSGAGLKTLSSEADTAVKAIRSLDAASEGFRRDLGETAAALKQVDQSLDPAVATRAQKLTNELRELGAQKGALDTFVGLKRETQEAKVALDQAQAAAQKLGRELAGVATPTQSQAAAMQKLRDAVQAAKEQLQQKTQQLDVSRAALTQMGVSTEQVAGKERQLRDALQGVRTEVSQLGQQAQAITGFKALAAETDTAAKRFREADAAVEAFRRELGDTNDITTLQQRQLQRLSEAARQAQIAFQQAAQTQAQAATALRQQGIDTDRLVTAQSRLPSQLTATAAAARAAAAGHREQSAAASTLSTTMSQLTGQLRTLQNIALAATGGTIIGSLAADVGETADAYSNLAARIKIATGASGDFEAAFSGVFDIAQRTGVAVESVGGLVVKLLQNGREMNLAQADALQLAETVSQALQISGASAQEAGASVTQFAQAIASGRLQGDELRSLLENAPRLAKALADGLGVSIGQLRELGSAGALTAQQVVAALQGQSAALQAEFDQLPPTVGRALERLSNEWIRYVGEVDKANGISSAAASAIGLLAENLETLGTLLWAAGKAAAAYTALRLAGAFLETATAARAATVAVAANTTATIANAAAQQGAAAAAGASAAAAGRLAGVLSTLKTLSLIGVVTNLETIGTALGEGIAKLQGYDQALEDLERSMKADEAAARANAAAQAELAQQAQRAADASFGLSAEAKKIVADFDGMRAKGDSVAEAMGKVAKSLDLSDVSGIQTAITALDALEVKGKVTGDQIRVSLAGALKGVDLVGFQTLALAAFDGSEQGARRLAVAIDAIAQESLQRAGTSLQELQTGFSAASTSAINDVDVLAQTLEKMGNTSAEAGNALARAIDKATEAAKTEKTLKAVEDRIKSFGKEGKLAGEQVAEALTKVQKKADELKPGINGLSEALRTFGLKTRAELTQTADQYAAAWKQIKGSTEVSLSDQIKAFQQYRDAAIAANKGIEPYQVALERKILESKAAVAGLGDAFKSAMDKAGAATQGLTDKLSEAQKAYDELLKSDPSRLVGGDGLAGFGDDGRNAGVVSNNGGTASGGSTNAGGDVSYDKNGFAIVGGQRFTGSVNFPPPPGEGWTFVGDSRTGDGVSPEAALRGNYTGGSSRVAIVGVGYWTRDPSVYSARRPLGTPEPGTSVGRVGWTPAKSGSGSGGKKPDMRIPEQGGVGSGGMLPPDPAPSTPSPTPSPAPAPSRTVRVELVVGGGQMYAGYFEEDVAAGFLGALEQAKRSAGG